MTADGIKRRASERGRCALRLATGLLAAGALLFAANWKADRQERVRMEAFRGEVADMALISEVIIADRLREYDRSLLVLREMYVADPERFPENIRLLRAGPLADPDLLVVLLDRQGVLAYTDAPNVKPRLHLGDRKYFRHFADGGGDRLYVDEPTFGRVTKRYTLPLARPIYDAQGGFLGVVAISVKQDSLGKFGSSLQLSEDTAITVINSGGAVISRSRNFDLVQGTRLPPQLLAPMLKGREGVFQGRAVPDDAERIMAYRRIGDENLRLVVYAEASPVKVLREISQQRAALMWMAVFASFITMSLIMVYLKGRDTTLRLIDSLRKSRKQEYEALTGTSLDGFWISDAAGRILDSNDTLRQMLGYTKEELRRLRVMDLDARQSPEQLASHARLIKETGGDRFMSVHRRKDGSVMDVEISVQCVKGPEVRFFVFVRDVTEQKLAEEALRHISERLLLATKAGGVGVWELDAVNGSLIWDDQMFGLYGIKPDTFGNAYQAWLAGVHPDDLPQAEAELQTVMRDEKKEFDVEFRVVWPNGTVHFLKALAQARRDASGQLLSVTGVNYDVTERRLKESVLQETEHLLQLTGRHADLHDCMSALTASMQTWSGCEAVGVRICSGDDYPYFETRGFPPEFVQAENHVCAYDADGRILRDCKGNPVLECMCGNVLLGRVDQSKAFFTHGGSFWSNDTSALLAGTTEADRQARTRNRCNGEGYESVALVPLNTGTRIIGLLQFNDRRTDRFTPALINHFEAIAGKLALSLEQRKAEKELQKSETLFRTLVNTIPDLIWLKDPEGVYLSCNAKFERFFGAKEADIVGKTDYDFLDRERADFFRGHDRKAMAAGKPTSNEEWITFPDDGYRALLFTTKMPMSDHAGKLVGILGIGRDISEIKRNEEERAKLESDLHQAQKMESVGSLAGGVAHDFNNKLSVILGHAYLALSEPITDQVRDSLEEIRKAAEQSADLTRQLLAFARRQTIAPKVLDLNEAVTGMLKMLNRLIGEDIHLTWQPAADLWLIKFDPSQLDQIFANLCVNARDSIAQGGKITIESGNSVIGEDYCAQYADASPGEYVRLVVSDNGCGIDDETLPRIFEPFFTTKEIGKGTGLGLATVFGIVKQNDGFINVYSEPGHGTTFTIYLPRYAGKLERREVATVSALRGLETVLLVEDEAAILGMVTTILARLGYRVLPANTPAEAVRLAEEHLGEISLLVTDVIMPEMNGKDLANALKSVIPELKCLFMSGYTADAISHHGVLEKDMHFIQKPFSLPAIASKVREILDGK